MCTRFLIIASLLALVLTGCEQAASPASKKLSAAQAKGEPTGIKADCVICIHHPMDITTTTLSEEYEGKRYYFCTDYCKQEFEKDPAKAIETYERERTPPEP